MSQYADEIPDEDEVLHLHDLAIKKFGGEPGVLKEGCVESSLKGSITSALYQGANGLELLQLVSYLLFRFANNHCFIDGNKRIAWMVSMDVLNRHHLTIDATNDEAAQMVKSVVEDDDCDEEWIKIWIAQRLIALDS